MQSDTYISFYLPRTRLHIFSSTIREIGNPKFIRFLVNEEEMQLVVQPYHRKDFRSHRVPTRKSSDRWEMEISSNPLCMLLANKLDWDLNRSYRVPGRILPKQQIAIFDLKSAEIIDRFSS